MSGYDISLNPLTSGRGRRGRWLLELYEVTLREELEELPGERREVVRDAPGDEVAGYSTAIKKAQLVDHKP